MEQRPVKKGNMEYPNPFSKKLPNFCYECGKSIQKMKDHIRRAHPEKLGLRK